jgi:hypothetical protein
MHINTLKEITSNAPYHTIRQILLQDQLLFPLLHASSAQGLLTTPALLLFFCLFPSIYFNKKLIKLCVNKLSHYAVGDQSIMFQKILGENKSQGSKMLALDKTGILVVYLFV